MAKRPSTAFSGRSEAQVGGDFDGSLPKEPPETITTAIHIPKSTWNLLRSVAFHRAQDSGGRASVSRLIAELAENNRAEFEKELRGQK